MLALRRLGEFSLGRYTYEVLFDSEWEIWFVRRLDERRLRAVYQGDLEVEWVHDTALGEDFYLVKSDDETIYGYDLDAVIKLFTKTFSYKVNRYFIGPLLETLIARRGRTPGHFFGGFYADGFHEGYLPYPAESWDCDPRSLETMAKYITEAFPPLNRAYALANVALAVAKVFSPGVRLARRRGVFEDRIVINTPDLWPSLMYLFHSIIDLLGLDPSEVYYGWDRPVTTAEALKNLLMHSTAPLFLDEVGERGLGVVVQYGPEVAFANTPIGSEPLRRCPNCVFHYYNLRSVMVNTVLDHHDVEKLLTRHYSSEGELSWALRRLLIIKWDHTPARRDVEFSGRPILGCLRELWQDQGFRNRVLNEALGVVDLARMVMEALHTRYSVDTRPYTEALEAVAREQRE